MALREAPLLLGSFNQTKPGSRSEHFKTFRRRIKALPQVMFHLDKAVVMEN